MKFDSEDPRLTSYLLGELDEAENEEVAALLASDAEAREFVDSMRLTTEALRHELAAEAPQELDEMRRARIVKAAGQTSQPRWVLAGTGLAAAAALVIYLSVGSSLKRADEQLTTSKSPRAQLAQGSAESTRDNAEQPVDVSSKLTTSDPESGNSRADDSLRRNSELAAADLDSAIAATPPVDGVNYDPARPYAETKGVAGKGDFSGVTGTYGTGTGGGGHALSGPMLERAQRGRMAGEMSKVGGTGVGYLSTREYGDRYMDYRAYVEPAVDNPFQRVADQALSTFSIDVDTASYAQVRRYLRGGSLPPPSLVRIEELINYFDYNYPATKADQPFSVATEVSVAPWAPEHKLVRIGVKAREAAQSPRGRANLVFLLDVSGSMRSEDKLPLLKQSFEMLMQRLDPEDRIAIVVYAGASGLALPSTPVSEAKAIHRALRRLKSGGSTNGGAGIELAYRVASDNFIEGGINRVILATDGDFNVGTSDRVGLAQLIEQKAKSQVFLTVLGVGMSSYGDSAMEQLADKGNGNYAYIDTLAEAKKVLVDQLQSTLVTVAKDVKLQVEFNPKRVSSYRLIGYENRVLANEDFNNDAKDAGEIGAGHTVTALYEIVMPVQGKVDALRYQTSIVTSEAADSDELLTLKVRYKQPTGSTSMLQEQPVYDSESAFAMASADFKFACAVAAFGMVLRNSEHRGNATMNSVLDWAREGRSSDPHEYRAEFIQLVRQSLSLYR